MLRGCNHLWSRLIVGGTTLFLMPNKVNRTHLYPWPENKNEQIIRFPLIKNSSIVSIQKMMVGLGGYWHHQNAEFLSLRTRAKSSASCRGGELCQTGVGIFSVANIRRTSAHFFFFPLSTKTAISAILCEPSNSIPLLWILQYVLSRMTKLAPGNHAGIATGNTSRAMEPIVIGSPLELWCRFAFSQFTIHVQFPHFWKQLTRQLSSFLVCGVCCNDFEIHSTCRSRSWYPPLTNLTIWLLYHLKPACSFW